MRVLTRIPSAVVKAAGAGATSQVTVARYWEGNVCVYRSNLVIAGPTASGKSGFAVECAKRFNGEIISGDSIQIYRGLDIGSAKIREDEKQGIVHHLIDIKDAGESYSVKEFQELGRELIDDISERGKLPVVAGGTGLYIKALLYDYTFFDEEVKDNPYEELSNHEIYEPASLQNWLNIVMDLLGGFCVGYQILFCMLRRLYWD